MEDVRKDAGSKTSPKDLYVVKQDGSQEAVDFNKIQARISKVCKDMDASVISVGTVAQKVINGLRPGITTNEIDQSIAKHMAYEVTRAPEYGIAAGRIMVTRLRKRLGSFAHSFSKNYHRLATYVDPRTQKSVRLVHERLLELIDFHGADVLDAIIRPERDLTFTYFAYQTLAHGYLFKLNAEPAETPQQRFLAIALFIWQEDLDGVKRLYDLMSRHVCTHATPTLANCGKLVPGLSSCFLLSVPEDSIRGMYKTVEEIATISQSGGGMSLNISNIRCCGSAIHGCNGVSSGPIPYVQTINNTVRHVNQGGTRPGAIAISLEPWHPDIMDFIDLKRKDGTYESRARDVFLSVYFSDLFMRRAYETPDPQWSLFCPNDLVLFNANLPKWKQDPVTYRRHLEVMEPFVRKYGRIPPLYEVYGEEFERLYEFYESIPGLPRGRMDPRRLIERLNENKVEGGVPYHNFKDNVNRVNMQDHLGVVRSSNLCMEIYEVHDEKWIATCNLASVVLTKFVRREDRTFDHQGLHDCVRFLVKSIDRVIDVTAYASERARECNLATRPVSIGVQGFTDVFMQLGLAYGSLGARQLAADIAETMSHGAIYGSWELAVQKGRPYDRFEGSPLHRGVFHHERFAPITYAEDGYEPIRSPSGRWDWEDLRGKIHANGVGNSMFLGFMPTASTAQIFNNCEGVDLYMSHVFSRKVTSGQFVVVNENLVHDLRRLGLWNPDMLQRMKQDRGSIQHIYEIPEELRRVYRTAFETSAKDYLLMMAEVQRYVDQGISMNVWLPDNENLFGAMNSIIYYGWRWGLKTGTYYFRKEQVSNPIQFGLDPAKKPATATTTATTAVAASPPQEPLTLENVRLEEVETEEDIPSGGENDDEKPASNPSANHFDGPVCYPGCDNCGS